MNESTETTIMSDNSITLVFRHPNGGGESTYVVNGELNTQMFGDNMTEIVLEVNDESNVDQSNVVYQFQNADFGTLDQYGVILPSITEQAVEASEQSVDSFIFRENVDNYTLPQQHTDDSRKGRISVLPFDPNIKYEPPKKTLRHENVEDLNSVMFTDCQSDLKADVTTVDNVQNQQRITVNNLAMSNTGFLEYQVFNPEIQNQKFEDNPNSREEDLQSNIDFTSSENKEIKHEDWLFSSTNSHLSASKGVHLKTVTQLIDKKKFSVISGPEFGNDAAWNYGNSMNETQIVMKMEEPELYLGPHLQFKCPKCMKSFRKILSLKVHELIHEEPKECTLKDVRQRHFTCPTCSFTCLRRKEVKMHLVEEHIITAFLSCNLCKFVTLSTQEHTDHFETLSHKKMKVLWKEQCRAQLHPFVCCLCGYSAINIHRLETHILSHTDRKDFACTVCSYRGKSERSLNKHITIHDCRNNFSCPLCSYTTHNTYSVARHMKRMHVVKEKKFKCRDCESSFTEMCELRVHAMLMHKSIATHFCARCDFSTSRRKDYRTHLSLHNASNIVHLCDQCSYTCRNIHTMKRHKKRHLNYKPFKCPSCPKTFHESAERKRHTKIHSEEKPFVCTICQHRCKFRNTLTHHMKVHTDVKEFNCYICDYRTKYAGNLKKHLMVHDAEKRFSCELCPFIANRKTQLKQHLCKVHIVKNNDEFNQ